MDDLRSRALVITGDKIIGVADQSQARKSISAYDYTHTAHTHTRTHEPAREGYIHRTALRCYVGFYARIVYKARARASLGYRAYTYNARYTIYSGVRK